MATRILVIDDDPDLRGIAVEILRAPDREILVASDGALAFMIAKFKKPHLVVTDVVMPGAYGTSLVRMLQEERSTARIPVLIVSATSKPEMFKELLANPLIRFLAKPFSVAAFKKDVTELLSQSVDKVESA